jgi:hypothetical protein
MRKQRGVTMIGWLFLLAPMAVVLYACIRVGPEYMNYYKVVSALSETASKLKSDETLSPAIIRNSLERRFDTGYIDEPNVKDVAVAKQDAGWSMTVDYEKAVPLFGNLYVLMAFQKTVVIN